MPQSSTKIQLLIVEDKPFTREALAKLLFFVNDVEVVGLASSGQEAIAQAIQRQPDVVLLDLTLTDMDSLDIVETISNHLRRTRIIVMTNAGAAHYLSSPVSQQVCTLLVKPIPVHMLTKAIRHASQL